MGSAQTVVYFRFVQTTKLPRKSTAPMRPTRPAARGNEAGHGLAGRRTFAVRLHRKGYDIRHISEILGRGTPHSHATPD